MTEARMNELGQPIGFPLPGWKGAKPVGDLSIEGRYCVLEPINPVRHGADLCEAFCLDQDHRNWTYMPYGPLTTEQQVNDWITATCLGKDPHFFSILDRDSGKALGVASFLRITPAAGSIEVGHIHFSPAIQKSRIATECMFLMMREVFDHLGYRRYEWKCDALNQASRNAARRLGFQYEGIFRQATVYKERNRDTAWFAIVDSDWPRIRAAFEAWLDPDNFDESGHQRIALKARAEQ